MININFISRYQKTTLIYGIALCTVLILTIPLHFYCKYLQSKTEQTIKSLSQEIQKLNAELNKPTAPVTKNKKILPIPLIIRFLNHITETLPIGVYCSSISRNSRHWVIHGRSQSVNILTKWLVNLQKLSLSTTLKTLEFNEKNPDFPVEFHLEVSPLPPSGEIGANSPLSRLRARSRGEGVKFNQI